MPSRTSAAPRRLRFARAARADLDRGTSRLESLKRRVYLVAFWIVALAGLSGFALGTSAGAEPLLRWLYGPLMSSAALAFSVVSWTRRVPLRVIEPVTYLVASAFLVGRIGLTLLFTDRDVPVDHLLTDAAPWIASVFILAFVTLETRKAVWAASTLYAALLAVAAAHVAWHGVHTFTSVEINGLVQVFVIANAFYIVLLYFMARIQEEYGKAYYESKVMTELAHTDELTGVPNRRHISLSCRKELERIARDPRPFSVILLDIDRFKRINDVHGHATGDAVLKRVSHVMMDNLRAGDDFGRFGGEEFLVLAYGADGPTVRSLAERLRAALAADTAEGLPPVTASFGASTHQPGDTLEALVGRADHALYAAKAQGRDRVAWEG